MTMITRVTQLWDLLVAWSFCEDNKDIINNDDVDFDDYDNNNID